MRYAVYFTPAVDDPLTRAAEAWIGRSAFSGDAVKPIVPVGFTGEEFNSLTREPRRYGFHATLVAPFRLGDGRTEADLSSSADAFCERVTPFTIPDLAITRISKFFALTHTASDGVSSLASGAVDHFDHLRAPLAQADIERRKPHLLSERQRLYLHRHGYPYVKEEFRFHMTLTGPVEPEAAARVEMALHDRFGPLLSRPVEVSTITLFVEPELGADFTVRSIHHFGTGEARKYG